LLRHWYRGYERALPEEVRAAEGCVTVGLCSAGKYYAGVSRLRVWSVLIFDRRRMHRRDGKTLRSSSCSLLGTVDLDRRRHLPSISYPTGCSLGLIETGECARSPKRAFHRSRTAASSDLHRPASFPHPPTAGPSCRSRRSRSLLVAAAAGGPRSHYKAPPLYAGWAPLKTSCCVLDLLSLVHHNSPLSRGEKPPRQSQSPSQPTDPKPTIRLRNPCSFAYSDHSTAMATAFRDLPNNVSGGWLTDKSLRRNLGAAAICWLGSFVIGYVRSSLSWEL
jgi:hypothetical protein